ncbi:MAG TPA: hypothetical protein VNU26_01605 [Mycobacteriales bacterium]|nr:hypothetical protein [Mycobacteriales bacterium]
MSCSCSRRSFLRWSALAGTALLARPALGTVTGAPTLRPFAAPRIGGRRVLAGSLHDHSTDSDGDAPSDVVAAYVRAHAGELGLDFLSLTEHSDVFPASSAGADPWSRSAAVCAAHTGDGFAFLRGFEWTNDQQNHLNVIGSAGWVRRDEAFTMAPFWRWLATAPGPVVSPLVESPGGADGVGQFNHPSSKGPLNWDDYAYDAGAAARMATIEIRERAAGWYWFALMRGWTVGPVMNGDFHPWAASGLLANATPGAGTDGAGFYPGHRSLVVADDATPAALLSGLAARRTAASERPDLWATLRDRDGRWMGSTVEAEPGARLQLVVDAGTADSRIAAVALVQDRPLDDVVAAHYFGDNDLPRAKLSQHEAAYAEQHRRYVTSGGRATYKGGQEAPPPGATVLERPWEPGERTTRMHWTVPTSPSPRPDGAHWVYAVVTRADGARVTTAPLLVTT